MNEVIDFRKRPPTAVPDGRPIGVAPLANVKRFLALVETLRTRPVDLPGFGVFEGAAGRGKTVATIHAANTARAYVIELDSCVTRRGFVERVAREIGLDVPPRWSIEQLVDVVGHGLAEQPDRPLIIDEADHLVKRRTIEIVRDIYKRCAPAGASILLVGEGSLSRQLAVWERVSSRVLSKVTAEAISTNDVRLLAERVLPGVRIETGAVEAVHGRCRGSARRAVTVWFAVKQHVLKGGLKAVDAGTVERA